MNFEKYADELPDQFLDEFVEEEKSDEKRNDVYTAFILTINSNVPRAAVSKERYREVGLYLIGLNRNIETNMRNGYFFKPFDKHEGKYRTPKLIEYKYGIERAPVTGMAHSHAALTVDHRCQINFPVLKAYVDKFMSRIGINSCYVNARFISANNLNSIAYVVKHQKARDRLIEKIAES